MRKILVLYLSKNSYKPTKPYITSSFLNPGAIYIFSLDMQNALITSNHYMFTTVNITYQVMESTKKYKLDTIAQTDIKHYLYSFL